MTKEEYTQYNLEQEEQDLQLHLEMMLDTNVEIDLDDFVRLRRLILNVRKYRQELEKLTEEQL